MKSFRVLFPVLGMVAALAGCSAGAGANGEVDSAGTQAQAATTQVAQPMHQGRDGHMRRPHGGPDFLIHAALHEKSLNLSDTQRATIEGLAKADKPEHPAFNQDRASKLAASIRAGKVDTSLEQPAVDHEAAMKAHLAASAKALATLHDTLTPAQRTALVDAITAHQAEFAQHAKGEWAAKGGERTANRDDNGGEAHGRRGFGPNAHRGVRGEMGKDGERGERGPMGGFLGGLDLTQAQKDAIHQKLAADRPARPEMTDAERAAKHEEMKTKFEAMKKDLDAKLQSFKSDTFDATAFVTPPARPDGAKGPEMHGDRGKELSVIVSVLTPAQREKLAQRIEQGPPARQVQGAEKEAAGHVAR